MNILYVEDNYINRLVVQKVLQPMGDVKMARTGPEAIEMASLHSFDIILIDINLNDPEMDGIDVMEIVKKNPLQKDSSYVALTAYTGEDWKVKCMEAGFDSFYSKPIIPDELVKLINGLTNQ